MALQQIGEAISGLFTGQKAGSHTGGNQIRQEIEKALKNIDFDFDLDIPILSDITGFVEEVGESGLEVLKKTPQILETIPALLRASEDLLEDIPELFTSFIDITEKVVKLLPRILEIVDKLLEKLIDGLDYTLDEKNRSIILAILITIVVIWFLKNNTLIY